MYLQIQISTTFLEEALLQIQIDTTIKLQMEPFCSKVSRDSGCDPRSEEEKPNCVEARTTQHGQAKRGGGRKSQVLHIINEC